MNYIKTYLNSCGGNILINIGPSKEGIIAPIFEERLRQLGSWLKLNGEAIYNSRPWKYQNDTTNSDVWYTSNGNVIYAILLKYPANSSAVVFSSPQSTDVKLFYLNNFFLVHFKNVISSILRLQILS